MKIVGNTNNNNSASINNDTSNNTNNDASNHKTDSNNSEVQVVDKVNLATSNKQVMTNKTNEPTKLPQTGVGEFSITMIAVITIVGIISLIRYKSIQIK